MAGARWEWHHTGVLAHLIMKLGVKTLYMYLKRLILWPHFLAMVLCLQRITQNRIVSGHQHDTCRLAGAPAAGR